MTEYTAEDARRDLDDVLMAPSAEWQERCDQREALLAYITRLEAENKQLAWLNEILDDNFADLNEVWRRVNDQHAIVLAENERLKLLNDEANEGWGEAEADLATERKVSAAWQRKACNRCPSVIDCDLCREAVKGESDG